MLFQLSITISIKSILESNDGLDRQLSKYVAVFFSSLLFFSFLSFLVSSCRRITRITATFDNMNGAAKMLLN